MLTVTLTDDTLTAQLPNSEPVTVSAVVVLPEVRLVAVQLSGGVPVEFEAMRAVMKVRPRTNEPVPLLVDHPAGERVRVQWRGDTWEAGINYQHHPYQSLTITWGA